VQFRSLFRLERRVVRFYPLERRVFAIIKQFLRARSRFSQYIKDLIHSVYTPSLSGSRDLRHREDVDEFKFKPEKDWVIYTGMLWICFS
jgi:hypothetical protein